MSTASAVEPLETRIAPAFTFTPTLVTYLDVDGDLVTIKSSKPVLDDADFIRTAASGPFGGQQLQQINLSDDGIAADGLSLTITATPKDGHGDGLANVGFINAAGRILGAVSVDGDLGSITAGDTSINATALKSLSVLSLARFGTGNSAIAGSVGSIAVKTDVGATLFSITGSTTVGAVTKYSSLGALTIGGSLLGGSVDTTGSILVDGDIGP